MAICIICKKPAASWATMGGYKVCMNCLENPPKHHKRYNYRLKPEEIEEIRRMSAAGFGYKFIADIFGVSSGTVYYWINDAYKMGHNKSRWTEKSIVKRTRQEEALAKYSAAKAGLIPITRDVVAELRATNNNNLATELLKIHRANIEKAKIGLRKPNKRKGKPKIRELKRAEVTYINPEIPTQQVQPPQPKTPQRVLELNYLRNNIERTNPSALAQALRSSKTTYTKYNQLSLRQVAMKVLGNNFKLNTRLRKHLETQLKQLERDGYIRIVNRGSHDKYVWREK